MLHEVTSVIELVGWTMQGTTKVKGLSSEIPEDIEVDIFMAMEDSMKDNVKASYHSLYRDLRPCHVLKWTSSELGRSYAFLQRYAGTSQQRQELAEDAGEVGLIDSTQNVGKPRTRGSDQQYKLVGWTMQGTTKVKGLSSEIPEDIEVDIFMAMEDSMKDNVKASYHSLYRDLRPCHVLKWTSSELGRSYAFLQRYAGTSQQRQELAEDAGEVGLIDSTQNVGKPRTRGSDQQYSNWNRDC
ncbi:hypothetical protein FQR65_LT19364 [Abscondita terminalis]|nr:hypothetical protein FQR65_LT19364 [Abscondita terminalis]